MKNTFIPKDHPDLLVGLSTSDDAAVYRISDDFALIHTVDFFTPIVDDPYTYGAIAAANALSDVYAMGGEVVLALNICGFPKDLPVEMKSAILMGGADKVAEAGGVLAGGHTIDDNEPKYGLSVIGKIHPDRVLTKASAKPGDVLVLTKPLGVGIITTAAKGDMAEKKHVDEAIESMLKLNKAAAQIAQQVGVNECTDITGFALLGHAGEVAAKSRVGLKIRFDDLPFVTGARDYAKQYLFPAGACRNEEFYGKNVTFTNEMPDYLQTLLFTPETSGGLLLAVSRDKLAPLLEAFKNAGENCRVIGEVVEGEGIEVF